jgi:hypothetical protein
VQITVSKPLISGVLVWVSLMPEIACTLLRILDGRRIQWYREVLAELARAIADGTRRATTASH